MDLLDHLLISVFAVRPHENKKMILLLISVNITPKVYAIIH